ncbi:MAG TPA: aminotransferase class V-fold PLP-dependent enzyme [Bacteroidota bacterium]|nr:aminotransferase class V-fold PLP-dependent enzyme [Bacteroidota bacterium]
MTHESKSTRQRPIPGLPTRIEDLRGDIVGIETQVPLLDGSERPYVYLDNAASTPAFGFVLKAVTEFLPWYSGVHRGTGFKSLLATEVFDAAHEAVGSFVGADRGTATVIFTKNTTECINKLSSRMAFTPTDVVVTTMIEHHSNDLPWRKHARVIHVGITADGHPDLALLKATIAREKGNVKLVAVSGASNITGICLPVHEIARWAHEAGAFLFVDAAQLAPHRTIDMLPPQDPAHIDFLALSAHKLYAPFGTGALVGPRSFFAEGDPDAVGGGVVDVVTLDRAVWNKPPHKEEAGSPNVIGGVALAASLRVLCTIGMDRIAAHEQELLSYGYGKLKKIRNIRLYGPTERLENKVGVMAFNIEGMHHSLVAAILGTEGGIGVRDGCFCAHPYVKELLHVGADEDRKFTAEVLSGDKSHMPGMVRASLGCYNTQEDIDAMIEMLDRVSRGDYKGRYVQDRSTGAFHAEGYSIDFQKHYFLAEPVEGLRMHSEAS